MEGLFQRANGELSEIHFHLKNLEVSKNENEAQPVLQIINQKTSQLKETLSKLDNSIFKEQPTKRQQYKYRLDQLTHDYKITETSINNLQHRLTSKWRTTMEREELLQRRFKPNETLVDVNDQEFLVNDRLRQSHTAVDDLISQGTAILGSLRTQHMNLRGIKAKVLDLGLSTTTLRMIEKRLEEDWLIFLVLCVLFIIFMYCFYRFWKLG